MKWNGMEWNGGRERWWVGCAVADVESKLVKVALDLTHEMLIGLGLTTHALQHLCVKSLGYGMQSRNPLDGEETVLLVAGTTTLEPFCQLIPSSSFTLLRLIAVLLTIGICKGRENVQASTGACLFD